MAQHPAGMSDGDWDEAADQFYGVDPDEDDMCADCERIGSHWDVCGICGATMCSACFEMGCGVCKGQHK